MIALRDKGYVKSIGVSNFSPRHVEELIAAKLEAPTIMQSEVHLMLQQPTLRSFCEEHSILLQGYGHHKPEMSQHTLLTQVASALGNLPTGQPLTLGLLSMRWALQSAVALIPRSRKTEYIESNQRVFDFALPPEAMKVLISADANTSLYGLHEVFVRDGIR